LGADNDRFWRNADVGQTGGRWLLLTPKRTWRVGGPNQRCGSSPARLKRSSARTGPKELRHRLRRRLSP